MKLHKPIFTLLLFVSFATAFVACKKSDVAPILIATTYKNLAADPPSGGYNPTNGSPIGVTKKYAFFSFKTGAIVANTDSASTKWDVGFNGTNLIINSGTSGPGAAGAIIVTGIFNEILTAPDNGYLLDNKNAAPAFYPIAR